MGSEREQELARTATAPGTAPTGPAAPVGPTLGRYRLERELGAGAMGIVHAAFDPDLERRIALKVLRGASAGGEARERLLREARAMARLAHPNVVTVHEVGTAAGRDFVAMELIQGETLADWLRASKRPRAAILEAFVAAGRGLAAAHAAGIVHRDFKPHNVLRSRQGRIVVTDFGLAREAEVALPAALDATLELGAARSTVSTAAMAGTASTSSGSSPLAGLTVTGSLLGTPAYMAPEQWHGGAVTPATDQFAYCVGLWEALAGDRPYPGPTFEDLRAQVARGPAGLDASRIPRRVRGLLRRGLDPDPARRWPSMDALLAQLVRAQRRPGVNLALAVGGLAAAALLLARGGRDAPVATCEPPARDVASVWSPAIRTDLRAHTSDAHVAVLDTEYWAWQAARAGACSAPPQVRHAQLQCLDGVRGRFEALRQAFARVPGAPAEELQAQMIDPAICKKPAAADVPRLTLAATPDAIAAYALLARAATDDRPSDRDLAAVIDAATADPCARVIAALAFDKASSDASRQRAQLNRAISAADQCGDDRLHAELRIRAFWHQADLPVSKDRGEAALQQAEIAARRVMQPDLAAAVAAMHRALAAQHGRQDEVFSLLEQEIAGYRAAGLPSRQLKAVIARANARLARSDPADLDAIMADARSWRPVAMADHRADLARQLDVADAEARLWRGDLARAHADLVRLWQARPRSRRPASGRTIAGEVVDDHGRPVAGATVAAGLRLFADSIGIGLPVNDDNLQITTTDASGRFVLHDASATGPIAAQLGDRRSRPVESASGVKLVLEPTRSVSGRVDLAGLPHTRVRVYCYPIESKTLLSITLAPVAPDGSFSISGLMRGAVFVTIVVHSNGAIGGGGSYRRLPASSRSVADVALAVTPATRALDVVVRSTVATAIGAAGVWVLPGRWEIRGFSDLFRSPALGSRELHPQPVGDSVPPAMAGNVRSDDLLEHVEHLTQGELTVCASSFPAEVSDPGVMQRIMGHLSDLAMKCAHVAPDAPMVILSVPPQPRFDEP